MSTTKKYYFFQISDEKFFDNVRIKALEMDDPKYVLSFQRLVLKAIKTNEPGFLALDPAFESLPEQIATLISCDLDYAENFFNACLKRHLFEESANGIQIPLAKELTASRTEKADEMKKRRQLVRACKAEDSIEPKLDDVEVVRNEVGTKGENCSIENRAYKLETKDQKPEPKVHNLQSNIHSSNSNIHSLESIEREETIDYNKESNFHEAVKPVNQKTTVTSKSRTEKEKADSAKEPAGFRALCKRVVDYLNDKTGYNWHPFASVNTEPIRERLAEGFVEEDFYAVVDVKTPQWQNEKMRAYLRPSTLFGQKMDNYLQETRADKVYDKNSTSFRFGNTVFNAEGHILRDHGKVPKDYQKPKMAWQQV